MSVLTDVRLGIELGSADPDHEKWDCHAFAHPLLAQLNSGKYDVCATMPLPASREAWENEHRTARKRAWRADRAGYWAKPFPRHWYPDDIAAINKSRPYRQGRPMDLAYATPDVSPLPDYPCELHAIRYYGVFFPILEPERDPDIPRETLVAYMQVYRSGDLALVSQVLGHADHEIYGVMHLLHRHFLEAEGQIAPGVAVYNRFDSGTAGLRQFKSWIGYEETPVQWLP